MFHLKRGISDEVFKLDLDILESTSKTFKQSTMLKMLENKFLHLMLVDFLNNLQSVSKTIPVCKIDAMVKVTVVHLCGWSSISGQGCSLLIASLNKGYHRASCVIFSL